MLAHKANIYPADVRQWSPTSLQSHAADRLTGKPLTVNDARRRADCSTNDYSRMNLRHVEWSSGYRQHKYHTCLPELIRGFPSRVFSFLALITLFSRYLRYNSRLSLLQPPRVPRLLTLLRHVDRRMHHLLWERRGHRPVRLWTYVSLLRMWPETQEDGQCVLPHLQEDNQRHHQDLPELVGSSAGSHRSKPSKTLQRQHMWTPCLFLCAVWLRYS